MRIRYIRFAPLCRQMPLMLMFFAIDYADAMPATVSRYAERAHLPLHYFSLLRDTLRRHATSRRHRINVGQSRLLRTIAHAMAAAAAT